MENLHLNVCLGSVQLMLSRGVELNMSSSISIVFCKSADIVSCDNAYVCGSDSTDTVNYFIGEGFDFCVSGNKDEVFPRVF